MPDARLDTILARVRRNPAIARQVLSTLTGDVIGHPEAVVWVRQFVGVRSVRAA
jgi:hypothetical protein